MFARPERRLLPARSPVSGRFDARQRGSWIFLLIINRLLTIATGESLDSIHTELDVARSASSSP